MSSRWAIVDEDLETRPRRGGATAEKGFTFQKAYALVRLTWMPTGEKGLVELRYEGAQDIDLRYADGREVLVQAKALKPGTLSFGAIKEVIASFSRDRITAIARGRRDPDVPKFRLVCTSSPYEEGSYRILRRVFIDDNAKKIEPLIGAAYREGLDQAEVLKSIALVLETTEFEIIVHEDAAEDLKAQAAWNLVRFGVPPEYVEACLDRLLAALVPRATLQASEVVEHLVGLPDGHPGIDGAPCRLLPSRKSLEITASRRAAFLQGAAQSLWAAVANGLDVARVESGEISDALLDMERSGGMVVVEGIPGAGKSALIRRVAWNAHQAGTHLVLDVSSPGSLVKSNWTAILSLLKLSKRPLLLVIDDVWRHTSFLDELDARVKPRLCVLATSRDDSAAAAIKAGLARLAVHTVKLGRLSDTFVDGLRKLVESNGLNLSALSSGQIARFIDTGQLLALSLTLQGGSLHRFAEGVLGPLREKSSFNDFIDLCVIGRYDNTVPLSLLDRSKASDVPFWHDPSFQGLVWLQETRGRAPRLRVGHAIVAKALVEVSKVDLVERAIHLCANCDPSNPDERRVVIRLLENIVADLSLAIHVRSNWARLANSASGLLSHVSFADAHRLAALFKSTGQDALSQTFLAAATVDRIADRIDIGLALSRKTQKEFNVLFPRLIDHYSKDEDSPGRRRFVRAAREFGSHEQQLVLGEQTAKWCVSARFPLAETLEVLHLSVSAHSNEVALVIRPMIQACLASDYVSIEILRASVRSVRRTRDANLAADLVRRALEVLRVSSLTSTDTVKLIRDLVLLLSIGLEDSLRTALSNVMIPALDHVEERNELVKAIHAGILLGCSDAIEPLRRAILAVKRNGWLEANGLEKHFKHQFKLEVGTI